MVISNDSKIIISASSDKSVKMFDLQAQLQLHHFENIHRGIQIFNYASHSYCHIASINTVVISNDSKFILSGSSDKTIKTFDLQTKQQQHIFAEAQRNSKIPIFILPQQSTNRLGICHGSIK